MNYCSACHGSGQICSVRPPDPTVVYAEQCPQCHGRGTCGDADSPPIVTAALRPCGACNGTGVETSSQVAKAAWEDILDCVSDLAAQVSHWDPAYKGGAYDSMALGSAQDAFELLVQHGRWEWVDEGTGRRCFARPKERS